MTAKEMFEKLGYKYFREARNRFGYKTMVGETRPCEILFDTDTKTYHCNLMITIQEHQAITQQMKELGWIE